MNEIVTAYGNGSSTIDRRVISLSGEFWNGSSFEAWVAGNIATYSAEVPNIGGGVYIGDFPTGITDAGFYLIALYLRLGLSASVSDTFIGGDLLDWTGTEERQSIQSTAKMTGSNVSRSGDTITIYEDDGTTPWRQYNLSSGGRVLI